MSTTLFSIIFLHVTVEMHLEASRVYALFPSRRNLSTPGETLRCIQDLVVLLIHQVQFKEWSSSTHFPFNYLVKLVTENELLPADISGNLFKEE